MFTSIFAKISLRRFASGLALTGLVLIFAVVFYLVRNTSLAQLQHLGRLQKAFHLLAQQEEAQLVPTGEWSTVERERRLRQPIEVPDHWLERCLGLGGNVYRVQLLSREGALLASSHPTHVVAPPPAASLPAPGSPPFAFEQGGHQAVVAAVTEQGHLVGYCMLSSRDESASGTYLGLLQLGCWAIPPLAFIVLTKVWLGSHLIARPLETLSACAVRVAAGDLNVRVDPREGPLEVYQASGAFNAMLSQLQALLEAQNRFVADASHELRAPLASLRGQLYTLSVLESHPDKRVHRALEVGNREILRMAALVDSLLALTRAEAAPGVRETLSLVEVLDESIALTEPLFPGRTIIFHGSHRRLLVQAEEAELIRAFRNVLENALYYSQETPVVIQLHREGANVRIEVCDLGAGVPASEIPHLGRRFFRVDPSRSRNSGGNGLGLAITKAILTNLGGQLNFCSQLGQGSQVSLLLPLMEQSGPPSA